MSLQHLQTSKIRTDAIPSWCPGCFNFQVMAGVQQFLEGEFKKGKKKKDFAIVSGIGCHAKIFDYMDMPGINTLHGRVPPACMGLKIAKPELTVLGFSGDGDAYAEGLEHLVHAARFNSDFKYMIHNNQVFALTLGEPTPVTNVGFADKTTPQGVFLRPMNPIKLMLSAGATFVARVNADAESIRKVLVQANKHKGFAFIEILQPCIIFHLDAGYRERMYDLQSNKVKHNTASLSAAMARAEEYDYSSAKAKIPMGIFYNVRRPTFEELRLGNKKKSMKSSKLSARKK